MTRGLPATLLKIRCVAPQLDGRLIGREGDEEQQQQEQLAQPLLATTARLHPQPPRSPDHDDSNNISPRTGAPWYPKADESGGLSCTRLSMSLELAIVPRAHWLSRLRSCLRLLVIVLSGAVVCMLTHTFEIYRGNRYIELRKGEIPMVWPAHTNLAPTIVLFVIAAANFLASVAILSLGFKRSFRRPFRSRDVYRIVAGSFGVIMWITALVVFHLLDKASKASLGRYSCTNTNVLTNGRYQYRAVCEEQVGSNSAHINLCNLLTPPPGHRFLHRHGRRLCRTHHPLHPRHLGLLRRQDPTTRTHDTNPREKQLDKLGLKIPQAPKTIILQNKSTSLYHNHPQFLHRRLLFVLFIPFCFVTSLLHDTPDLHLSLATITHTSNQLSRIFCMGPFFFLWFSCILHILEFFSFSFPLLGYLASSCHIHLYRCYHDNQERETWRAGTSIYIPCMFVSGLG
jgi:hypothetical protein